MNIDVERINIQTDSVLATGMEDLFQEVMTYRDGLQTTNSKERIKLVLKKSHDMLPKLKQVLYDTIGITVKGFYLSSKPSGGFAILISSDNKKFNESGALYKMLKANTGITDHDNHTLNSDDMIKLTNQLNMNTGIVKSTKIQKINLEVYLSLDLYTMFLSKETLNTELKRFTARELTAIELHEIGHFITLLENAKNKGYVVQAYMDNINYFNKYAPIKEKIKYAKHYIDSNREDKIINNLEGINITNENSGNVSWLLLLLLFTTSIIPNFLLKVLFGYNNVGLSESNKNNDLKSTTINTSHRERIADEFVSAFKYSKDLVSGLALLDDYFGALLVKDYLKINSSQNKLFFTAELFKMATVYDSTHGGIYPEISERFVEILRDNISILRQSDISKELKIAYFKECESILNNIQKMQKTPRVTKVKKSIEYILSKCVSAKGLYDMVINSRFSNEYKFLYDSVSNLINNKLYLSSFKYKK